jgi:hypothetical protein
VRFGAGVVVKGDVILECGEQTLDDAVTIKRVTYDSGTHKVTAAEQPPAPAAVEPQLEPAMA